MDKRIPYLTFEEFMVIKDGTDQVAYKAFQKCLERVHAVATQHALLAFPEAMMKLLQVTTNMQAAKKEFLKDYPDVAKRPDLLAEHLPVAEEEHPGEPYAAVLTIAAERVREDVSNFRSISEPGVRPNKNILTTHLKEALEE